jgi:CMP-N,N'-diacetyllegionaminic acid synthase
LEVCEIRMSKFGAIIPARSGSKSIKDKNLALLGGYPLIAYSIALAKMTAGVDRVIVSTDSLEYAKIAEKYGAEVPFLRPKELSQDTSTDYDFMSHTVNFYNDNFNDSPELWIHLRPTTPLRDTQVIEKAMALIANRQDATSLRSGHLSPESPFKWFRKNRDGFLTSLDGNDTNLDKYNGPRQDFPDVLIPNGYVDIVRSSFIMEKKLLHGDKVLAFETPFCNELDAHEELELLEYQLQKKYNCELINFLKSIK